MHRLTAGRIGWLIGRARLAGDIRNFRRITPPPQKLLDIEVNARCRLGRGPSAGAMHAFIRAKASMIADMRIADMSIWTLTQLVKPVRRHESFNQRFIDRPIAARYPAVGSQEPRTR